MPTELHIEKLVYGGDGLARLPADVEGRRLTAFVPGVIPGETVEANIPRAKQGFVRANLLRILDASPERVEPRCRHFGTCGGCQWQHMSHTAQTQARADILRETFSRAGTRTPAEPELPQIHTLSADPWQYRNRVRLHVDELTRRAGYLVRRSHRVLPITECPIASPLIERAVVTLSSTQLPPGIAEIELFASSDDSALSAAFYAAPGLAAEPLFASLQQSIPQLTGIAVFDAEGTQLVETVGEPDLTLALTNTQLRVPAGAFFQANRLLLPQLQSAVADAAPSRPSVVWDLYAGVGLFAAELERRGHTVVAVEGAPASFAGLEHNVSHAQQSDVAEFLQQQSGAPECIVVDPPRTGLSEPVRAELDRLRAPLLVYLACDPVTMARDIAALSPAYKLESLTLIDLFPQTFHIEALATLRRA